MEKLIEIWEIFLSYLLDFVYLISRYTAKAWEAISPFLQSVWEKFLFEYCQFGAVCSDEKLTLMGGALLAVIVVSVIGLIFAVILLVRNS